MRAGVQTGVGLVLALLAFLVFTGLKVDLEWGTRTSADDARFTEVIEAGGQPGFTGDGGVHKFTDGPVTCYVTNGSQKAGLSCLVTPKEEGKQ